MKLLKTVFYIVFLAAVLTGIVGCNTVKGVGKDIERGGEIIQGK